MQHTAKASRAQSSGTRRSTTTRSVRVVKVCTACIGTVLPSQNSATESGRCTARAASKGRSEISAGQMVRTCKSTDTPCTLSAAQHSVLAHSPVRAA